MGFTPWQVCEGFLLNFILGATYFQANVQERVIFLLQINGTDKTMLCILTQKSDPLSAMGFIPH